MRVQSDYFFCNVAAVRIQGQFLMKPRHVGRFPAQEFFDAQLHPLKALLHDLRCPCGDRDAVFNVYESLLVAPPSDAGVIVSLLDDPKIQAQGFVREITPTVSAQSGTVQVKVGLRNVPPGMQLGAPVTATTNAQGRPSVELPWSALTKALHEPAVWVVGEGDKVELRKVEVTRYLTGKIVVASGLKSGETVVVSGGQLLHPNMQVHKIDAKDGGGAP